MGDSGHSLDELGTILSERFGLTCILKNGVPPRTPLTLATKRKKYCWISAAGRRSVFAQQCSGIVDGVQRPCQSEATSSTRRRTEAGGLRIIEITGLTRHCGGRKKGHTDSVNSTRANRVSTHS